MPWTAALLVVLAAVLVFVADRLYPGTARQLYQYATTGRRIVFGVFALVTALVFLSTGITGLMLVGFAILLYAFASIYYDTDLLETIGG
jgi:hypothetical protein